MKYLGFISFFASALMLGLSFTSCDKDGKSDVTQPDDNSDNPVWEVEAFLPSFCADKTVAAWYSVYSETDYKKKIEAIFLDTDSLMLYTRSVFYASGREPAYDMLTIGRYELVEGDYSTGKLDLKFSEDAVYEATVTDGQLPISDKTFIKQDIADLPDKI